MFLVMFGRWFTDPAEAAQHPTRAAVTAGGLAAVCGAPLAYFVLGVHSILGASVFAVLIGATCSFGTLRGLRQYQADPSPGARAERVRRSGVRLGAMWAVFLLFTLVALAVHSLVVLVIGVLMFIVTPLLLRLVGR